MPGQDYGIGPHRTIPSAQGLWVPGGIGQLTDILGPHRLAVLIIRANVLPQAQGVSVWGAVVSWVSQSISTDQIMGLGGWFSSC